jgi:hypothetical protein
MAFTLFAPASLEPDRLKKALRRLQITASCLTYTATTGRWRTALKNSKKAPPPRLAPFRKRR